VKTRRNKDGPTGKRKVKKAVNKVVADEKKSISKEKKSIAAERKAIAAEKKEIKDEKALLKVLSKPRSKSHSKSPKRKPRTGNIMSEVAAAMGWKKKLPKHSKESLRRRRGEAVERRRKEGPLIYEGKGARKYEPVAPPSLQINNKKGMAVKSTYKVFLDFGRKMDAKPFAVYHTRSAHAAASKAMTKIHNKLHKTNAIFYITNLLKRKSWFEGPQLTRIYQFMARFVKKPTDILDANGDVIRTVEGKAKDVVESRTPLSVPFTKLEKVVVAYEMLRAHTVDKQLEASRKMIAKATKSGNDSGVSKHEYPKLHRGYSYT